MFFSLCSQFVARITVIAPPVPIIVTRAPVIVTRAPVIVTRAPVIVTPGPIIVTPGLTRGPSGNVHSAEWIPGLHCVPPGMTRS